MTEDRAKVLYVDDDTAILKLFHRLLRRHLNVVSQSDPLQVEAMVASETFELFLVDYAMPGLNGVELIHRLRRTHPDTPCVLVTAHGDLDDVVDAHEQGLAAGLIRKPFKRDEILSVVKELLSFSERNSTTTAHTPLG